MTKFLAEEMRSLKLKLQRLDESDFQHDDTNRAFTLKDDIDFSKFEILLIQSGMDKTHATEIIAELKSGFYENLKDLLPPSLKEGFNPNHSEQQTQIEKVRRNPNAIQTIRNPSLAVQIEAVRQDGTTIRFINNPSPKVQEIAVQQNEDAAYLISNPSLKVQLVRIKHNPSAIKFVEDPSQELQLAAVTKNGDAIAYIKNPDLVVQLAAVRQKPHSIVFIENPSLEVQLEAVRQNPSALNYIHKPSQEVIDAARRQDGHRTRDIKNEGYTSSTVERNYRRLARYCASLLNFNNLKQSLANLGARDIQISGIISTLQRAAIDYIYQDIVENYPQNVVNNLLNRVKTAGLGSIIEEADNANSPKIHDYEEPLPELSGNINARKLAEILGLKDMSLFTQAIKRIRDGHNLTRVQALEIATAFERLLAASAKDKRKILPELVRIHADK